MKNKQKLYQNSPTPGAIIDTARGYCSNSVLEMDLKYVGLLRLLIDIVKIIHSNVEVGLMKKI